MNKNHLLIIGFGSVASGKYMRFINDYVNDDIITGYSILDIKSELYKIKKKIKNLKLKPENEYYISDSKTGKDINNINEFDGIIKSINKLSYNLKVFIATDPRYHEGYLEYCIDNNIDCLVEKPVITPIVSGKFDPTEYENRMINLINKARNQSGNFSVMSGSRYHEIFNSDILDNIKSKLERFKTPITSFHIRTSSGVWNLYNEFIEREDHPYKYGFGVLNHGAYHYLDVFAQCLTMNKNLLKDNLKLTINSFVAYPSDQSSRIPKTIYENFSGTLDENFYDTDKLYKYGETDIVSSFSLSNYKGKTIMLGTISLEHTTPCCRNWADLDYNEYNKNGRLPCTDIEVQLSTLYSVHAHMMKKPENYIKYYANVLFRSNKELLEDDKYYYNKEYLDFEGKGKFILIKNWLEGKDDKSRLVDHELTMKILEKLSLSVLNPGKSITFNI